MRGTCGLSGCSCTLYRQVKLCQRVDKHTGKEELVAVKVFNKSLLNRKAREAAFGRRKKNVEVGKACGGGGGGQQKSRRSDRSSNHRSVAIGGRVCGAIAGLAKGPWFFRLGGWKLLCLQVQYLCSTAESTA